MPCRPSFALPPLVAVLALVVGGCGSGSSGSTGSTAAAPQAKATSTSPKAAAAPATTKVAIKDFDYAPRRITVSVGSTVSWTNHDAANHTVTFDKSGKDLGNQPKSSTKHFRFTQPGTYAYHCDFHPNMHGTVVVK